MLSLPFVALSLASLALATPMKRAEGLTVALTPSSQSVNSIDELRLTASVTNNGAEDVKVLNYGSVLDNKLPTRSFAVTKDGAATNFTGIKLSLDTRKLTDESYTVIPAGKTVNVEHEVSALYDFTSAGSGVFSFEPVLNFRIASDSGLARVSKVDTTSVQVSVKDVSTKREFARKSTQTKKRSIGKRSTVSCDDSSLASFIENSYTTGQSLAAAASSYASSGGSLTTDYFGGSSISTVTGVLDAVANENDSSRTLNCDDAANACSQGVIAYTIISTTDIYFCDIFYDEQADPSALCSGTSVADRDISGGTTLHELTHATSDTDDITYGCSADQALADSQTVQNADNFNCFATAVYAASC